MRDAIISSFSILFRIVISRYESLEFKYLSIIMLLKFRYENPIECFTWWKTVSASFTDGLQERRLLYVTTDNETFKAFISTINFLAFSILPHFPYEYIIRLNSFWSGSMTSSALMLKYILSASSCFPFYDRN